MKAVVTLKRTLDYQAKISIKSDQIDIETRHLKYQINPFDEIALEEAIRWKERGIISEVIAVSIGTAACQEALRQALALGADRAHLLETSQALEPLAVATVLADWVREEQASLVIMGKQSIDSDNAQTPPMLAALLDWPQASFACELTLRSTHAEVVREIDDGLETVRVQLPAVISTDLRLNTPRVASLPNILKAKQKPLTIKPLDTSACHSTLQRLQLEPPLARKPGTLVNSLPALLQTLQQKGDW